MGQPRRFRWRRRGSPGAGGRCRRSWLLDQQHGCLREQLQRHLGAGSGWPNRCCTGACTERFFAPRRSEFSSCLFFFIAVTSACLNSSSLNFAVTSACLSSGYVPLIHVLACSMSVSDLSYSPSPSPSDTAS